MATAFTSWSALRTAIKDAIANHVAGEPCVGSYSIGSRKMIYRSIKELKDLFQATYEMEALENAGETSMMVSYGRHRRFR